MLHLSVEIHSTLEWITIDEFDVLRSIARIKGSSRGTPNLGYPPHSLANIEAFPHSLAQQIHPHFLNLIDSQSSKLEPHSNTSRAVIITAQPRSTRAEFFRQPTYNPTEASAYEATASYFSG